MHLSGLIYAALIFTQTAWSVFAFEVGQSSYYELWASKFESVQFEMAILRSKVTKGERHLATMRSEIESLAAAYSSKTEIFNKTDMRGPIAVNDVDVVDDNSDNVLRRAFMNEKLYTRKLEQRVQTALLNATNSMYQVRERINVTEEKCKSAFKEISRQINSLDRYTKTSQESQESKHEETSKAIERLTQDLARMNQIVTNQGNSIDRLGGKRCQSGVFSFRDNNYNPLKITPFPHIIQVNFNPPFKSKPSFMHGLRILRSTAPVDVAVWRFVLNKDFAKLEVFTRGDPKLNVVGVTWMACP